MFIGIMQGRLLPPIENRIQCFPKKQWAEEFVLAKSLGFQGIEWIYEFYGMKENPVASQSGIIHLKQHYSQYGIEVRSLCADYFMNFPMLRCSSHQLKERVLHLQWLIQQAADAGISSIVLPFVDSSKIENKKEISEVVGILKTVLPTAETLNIELHLETALSPKKFKSLLEQLPYPLIKVNYDTGNSASLGYSIEEEFGAYGSRIGSIHVKDRLLGGGTVPLGQGNVDFSTLQKLLKMMNYQRPVILQIARGRAGDEVNWTKKNLEFLKTKVPWIFS